MAAFDKVLVNPTEFELENALMEATQEANGRARARTVLWPSQWVGTILGSAAGARERNGGGVANSYGYAAESTVVEAAWATDAAGDKHVRIISIRTRCSGRHVRSILPGTRAQQNTVIDADFEACLVYQKLFNVYADWPGRRQDRLCKSAWLIQADSLEEAGKVDVAKLIRLFFGKAEKAEVS